MFPKFPALFDLDHTLPPQDTDEPRPEFLLEHGKLDTVAFVAANRDLVARYSRGEAGAIEFTGFCLSTLTSFAPAELAALHAALMHETGSPAAG